MIRPVTGRPVAVAVGTLDAGQESIERGHEVVVRARPDLDDDEARRGVRDEDREEAVGVICGLCHECGAGRGQVVEPAAGPRSDGELLRLYGKMLRIASRIRPSPPPAGADS